MGLTNERCLLRQSIPGGILHLHTDLALKLYQCRFTIINILLVRNSHILYHNCLPIDPCLLNFYKTVRVYCLFQTIAHLWLASIRWNNWITPSRNSITLVEEEDTYVPVRIPNRDKPLTWRAITFLFNDPTCYTLADSMSDHLLIT